MTQKILCVGSGAMGSAILKGWVAGGYATHFYVINPDEEAVQPLKELAKVDWFAHPDDLPADFNPDMILLAVKPQVMPQVLPHYKKYADSALFVTVAAGLPVESYAMHLGREAHVIKVMPNLPVAFGKGACVGFAPEHVPQHLREKTHEAFKALGQMVWVDSEDDFHAATALSGCGPAYLYLMTAVLEKVSIEQGLTKDTASKLARQTMIGAAALLEHSDENPKTLKERVTSPGGVTQAALEVLEGEKGLEKIFQDAIMNAVKRSRELSSA